MIQIVNFASREQASTTRDLDATSDVVETGRAKTDITFQNLNVHAAWDLQILAATHRFETDLNHFQISYPGAF